MAWHPRGITHGDDPYRSQLERNVAIALSDLGVPFEYEPSHAKLKYPVPDRVYVPDFVLPNGIILEVKGVLVAEDRTKMKRVKAAYPELDIRFIFGTRNKRLPGISKRTTHEEWADRYGFPWSIGLVPQAWINE